MYKLLITITLSVLVSLAFSQKQIHTCINEKGEVLFEFQSHYVWTFSDGLAKYKTVVVENGERVWRTGFIDVDGNVVIPAKFVSKHTSKYGFKYGVSWARLPESDGFFLINKEGQVLTDKTYEKVGSFNDSLCAVYEGLNMGFIDITGEEIIPCKYVGDSWFYDGLVCLCPGDAEIEAYGFFNKKGEQVIPFKFHQAGFSGFSNGECRVQINGKTNLINLKGEVVFTPSLTSNMSGFSCGLAKAYTKGDRSGFGFFNRNNEWVVQPIYDRAESFDNGRSVVSISDKYGVIDTTGKYIIPLKFDKIYGDCGNTGLFTCVLDNVMYYYNCDGMYFSELNPQRILPRKKSEFFPYKNEYEMWGYLSADGLIHIPAQYEDANSFVEGKAWVIKE